jgi:adenylylsulfate kinase
MSPTKQSAIAAWFTGLPAAGKSTIASEVARILRSQKMTVVLLDSDELRHVLTPDPTYSAAERNWFYDAVGFIAALLANNGVTTLIAATAPQRKHRNRARGRIDRFVEVYVDCTVEECRKRDPKGLWNQQKKGKISTLPGAGVPYEEPLEPEVVVDSRLLGPKEAARLVSQALLST